VRPVLITQRLVEASGYIEVRDALDVRWGPFLQSAGLVPIALPDGVAVDAMLECVPRVAGLILTGGNDLSSVDDSALSVRRDRTENAACDRARELGLPILGVCRGLQLLGARSGMALESVDGHVATRHALDVSASSQWLAAFAGREVNSYHGFAPADGSSAGMNVAARSADGCVEALESADGKCLGIMWHPEREERPAEADVALFRSFFGDSR